MEVPQEDENWGQKGQVKKKKQINNQQRLNRVIRVPEVAKSSRLLLLIVWLLS